MLKWLRNLFGGSNPEEEARRKEYVNQIRHEAEEAKLMAATLSEQSVALSNELFETGAIKEGFRQEKEKLYERNRELEKELSLIKTQLCRVSGGAVINQDAIEKYLDERALSTELKLKPYIDMNADLEIRFKKLNHLAKAPTKFFKGDAGYDLFMPENTPIELRSGERTVLDLGIVVDIPEGYYARLVGRSSCVMRQGILVVNEIVDSNFSGTLKLVLFNSSSESVVLPVGGRIAQLVLEKIHTVKWVETKEDLVKKKNLLGTTGQ